MDNDNVDMMMMMMTMIIFHSKIGPHLLYPGFHRLFMRGFRFRLSIKK